MQPRVLIIGLLCVILGKSVSAEVITFNDIAAEAGNQTEFGSLVVAGFVFTSPHAHVITSPQTCGPHCADNGTQWLGGDTSEITMARQDGGRFSLTAFDAAEAFSSAFQHPTHIVLSGASDRPVTSFTFDGINDGVGPLADFQTFFPDSRWTGLRRVTFQGVGATGEWFGLDNIVVDVAPVPEPGTLLLFGSAAGAAALRAARRRRIWSKGV